MEDCRIRLASVNDIPALRDVMRRAIDELQTGLLSTAEIQASHAIMGLDTQLITDGTYFVAEIGGRLAGGGGWSRRATLYGGDGAAALRDARLLDPAREPARVRAMYTDPDFARRGVGRRILAASEAAAREAGFATVELMATLSGARLYRVCGYAAIEDVVSEVDGMAVPLVRMRKFLV